MGRDPEGVTRIPYDDACEPGFEAMHRRVPDIARIKRLTGWEPRVPLEETLRQVVAFFLWLGISRFRKMEKTFADMI